MEYKINAERLLKNIETMSGYGMNSEGGIDRALGSNADAEVRKYIKNYWEKEIGVETMTDGIANIWATREGSENLLPIVTGSHHDAVPNGGKYDGAIGVLIATEIMQTIVENNIKMRHPLKIISFTGEEPNPYSVSTLGSKVISGRLVRDDLKEIRHRQTDEGLLDCIKRLGGSTDELENTRIGENRIAAFLEVHNELGGYLESQDAAVSAVEAITGIYREKITVYGEANHAGTTMMNQRKDAFLAMAELGLLLNEKAEGINDPNLVATMGYVKVTPNEANVIPFITESIIDIRAFDEQKKNELLKGLSDGVNSIEAKRGVKFKRETILDQPVREMDKDVRNIVEDEMKRIGAKELTAVSMAGHDASNMQLLTKSGMIFVRSIGGKGHCKEEFCTDEDIKIAAQLALNVVLRLDEELKV